MKQLFFIVFSLLALLACKKPSTVADDVFQNVGNPLFRNAFTADPATLVVGDRLYVYTGHDECYEDSVDNPASRANDKRRVTLNLKDKSKS